MLKLVSKRESKRKRIIDIKKEKFINQLKKERMMNIEKESDNYNNNNNKKNILGVCKINVIKRTNKMKMNNDSLLTVNMKIEGEINKILIDTGATTEMVEERVKFVEEKEVNEIVEYADGMTERIRRKRMIELELGEGEKMRVWALVVKSLPERLILGNSFLKGSCANIDYGKMELDIKKRGLICNINNYKEDEKTETEKEEDEIEKVRKYVIENVKEKFQ